MIDGEQLRETAMLIKSGCLAAFGGMVGYLVDVTHGQKTFSWLGYGVFVVVVAVALGEQEHELVGASRAVIDALRHRRALLPHDV